MRRNSINNHQLLTDLLAVKEKTGKLPTYKSYRQYGCYHRATIERHFGSWNKALILAFGTVNRVKPPKIIPKPCSRCGKSTKNNKYCSRTCAAIVNNSVNPKRKKSSPPLRICSNCGKLPTRSINGRCRSCYIWSKIEEYSKKQIREFTSTFARHKYQKIRLHAHRVAKFLGIETKCHACQYTRHTELCHIKAIKDFPKTATLSEVNSKENLVYLCPTHHWELENGFLEVNTSARI